jgi:hypothetical protein
MIKYVCDNCKSDDMAVFCLKLEQEGNHINDVPYFLVKNHYCAACLLEIYPDLFNRVAIRNPNLSNIKQDKP